MKFLIRNHSHISFRLSQIFLLAALCFTAGSWAQAEEPPSEKPETFEALFKTGVESYRAQKYEPARDAFVKALQKDPQNVSVLTNLALSQFQLGKKGLAVAYLRKAQSLDPDFSTPKAALQFILPQLEVKEIPHELHFFENLRTQVLVPVPLSAYLVLTLLLLFASGWILLGYWGERARALKNEKPFPPFPLVGALLTCGLLVAFGLATLKVYDHQTPRGTILEDKVAVVAAPDEKAAVLFDLYSGLEVIIANSNQDWVQVTYPGALTGWIPKTTILHTAGKAPW